MGQRDKRQVNAVCLLSSSRTPATQRAGNTRSLSGPSRQQAYYTTRSPGAGRVEGVPAVGSRLCVCVFQCACVRPGQRLGKHVCLVDSEEKKERKKRRLGKVLLLIQR